MESHFSFLWRVFVCVCLFGACVGLGCASRGNPVGARRPMGKNSTDLEPEVGGGGEGQMGEIKANLIEKCLIKANEMLRFTLRQTVKAEDGTEGKRASSRLKLKSEREASEMGDTTKGRAKRTTSQAPR